jgi:hypothetical protein
MLGKVSKTKYVDHDISHRVKFPEFMQEAYLEDMEEVGPLGKPIMEPT